MYGESPLVTEVTFQNTERKELKKVEGGDKKWYFERVKAYAYDVSSIKT